MYKRVVKDPPNAFLTWFRDEANELSKSHRDELGYSWAMLSLDPFPTKNKTVWRIDATAPKEESGKGFLGLLEGVITVTVTGESDSQVTIGYHDARAKQHFSLLVDAIEGRYREPDVAIGSGANGADVDGAEPKQPAWMENGQPVKPERFKQLVFDLNVINPGTTSGAQAFFDWARAYQDVNGRQSLNLTRDADKYTGVIYQTLYDRARRRTPTTSE